MRDSNVMSFINDAIPGGSNGTANGINAARHSDRSHDRWAGPLRNQDAAPPTPETKTFQNEVAALRTEVFVPRGRFPSCTPAPQSSGRSPTRTTPQTNNRKNRSPTWPPIHALPCHGLQPERTDLAWRRTSPSLVVAAAIIVRWMPHHGLFREFTCRRGNRYRLGHKCDSEKALPSRHSRHQLGSNAAALGLHGSRSRQCRDTGPTRNLHSPFPPEPRIAHAKAPALLSKWTSPKLP